MFQGEPGGGEVEEYCVCLDGLGGVFEDGKAVCADVAVSDSNNGGEVVGVDFGGEFLEAGLVEFEGEDFAGRGCWRWICGGGWGGVGCGVTVEYCSSGRMGEGATAGSGFDEDAAGADSEALEDVAVVWGVDYLRPVRERHGPCFRCGWEKMDESGRSRDDFFPRSIFGAMVGILVNILNRIGFQLPLLARTQLRAGLGLILSFTSSRASING